jgi:L,D-transpeptidase ErfK/SrfK
MKRHYRPASFAGCGLSLLALAGPPAHAELFQLPGDGSDLIGRIDHTTSRHEDTLIDIARRFSVGQIEMVMANPGVDNWSPGDGTQIVIPNRFILPEAPRAGIVVNVPEMRLYYYPVKYATVKKKPTPKPKTVQKGKPTPVPVATNPEVGEPIGKAAEVLTFPISMGRMDWRTPLGKARVVQKVKDPVWVPPASIKKEHAAKGDILPDVVPAGPNNPLGLFAMKLSVPGYLIHGTESADKTKPFGIGMRVTHGCMRMYNEDVEKLFPQVSVGTPVHLVNQPVKLGWRGGSLFMEVSQPLDEDAGIPAQWDDDTMDEKGFPDEKIKEINAKKAEMKIAYLQKVANAVVDKELAKRPAALDREAMREALLKPTGIPVEIGREGESFRVAPAPLPVTPSPVARNPIPPLAEQPPPPVEKSYRRDPEPLLEPAPPPAETPMTTEEIPDSAYPPDEEQPLEPSPPVDYSSSDPWSAGPEPVQPAPNYYGKSEDQPTAMDRDPYDIDDDEESPTQSSTGR